MVINDNNIRKEGKEGGRRTGKSVGPFETLMTVEIPEKTKRFFLDWQDHHTQLGRYDRWEASPSDCALYQPNSRLVMLTMLVTI